MRSCFSRIFVSVKYVVFVVLRNLLRRLSSPPYKVFNSVCAPDKASICVVVMVAIGPSLRACKVESLSAWLARTSSGPAVAAVIAEVRAVGVSEDLVFQLVRG